MEDSPQPLDGNLGAHVLHVEQEGVEGRPQVPAVPHSEGAPAAAAHLSSALSVARELTQNMELWML